MRSIQQHLYDKGGSSQETRIARTQYTGKKKRWKGKAIVHKKLFYQPNYVREADATRIESITVGNRTLKPGTRAFELAKKIIDEQEQTFAVDAKPMLTWHRGIWVWSLINETHS